MNAARNMIKLKFSPDFSPTCFLFLHFFEADPALDGEEELLDVAVQVAFERQILKPVSHLIGARVETRRLSVIGVMGRGESTCTAPP
jgi:hypothetical protein